MATRSVALDGHHDPLMMNGNGSSPGPGASAGAATAYHLGPPTTSSSSSHLGLDSRNLEIKTKSIEHTLVPLVTQITTLVNYKESCLAGGKPKSERAIRAALKIGSAVEAAIERFVSIGETIADENADIQPEMYDACHEARLAGASIANLTSLTTENGIDSAGPGQGAVDKAILVRASRQLLSSVTRVLLLADRVLVKHILRAEDKVAYSLSRLESTRNFTEFVKIFAEFGGEMVDLAHRSGDRQHDLKSEKRRAQMGVARSSLERLTMLLLTSSKTLLRHPESDSAQQCRDGVFDQIRLALQLIAICVSDGVYPLEGGRYAQSTSDEPLDIGIQLTANAAIKQLTEMLEMVRMTSRVGAGVRERLVAALDALCEMTQDFTDSAYTAHHQREQVLDFLEECRFEMTNLIQPTSGDQIDSLRLDGLDVTVERLNRRLKDLGKQLQIVAMEQISEVLRANEDQVLLSSIKACAVSGDIDGVEKYMEKFREHAEHMQEVCRLLHHISITDALHVNTGHCERSMRALAPLTILASRTLCLHPSSRIARENLEVFCDTWGQCVNDLSRLAKETDIAASGRVAAERQAYMSLPRPGVSGVSSPDSGYNANTKLSLPLSLRESLARMRSVVSGSGSPCSDSTVEHWRDRNPNCYEKPSQRLAPFDRSFESQTAKVDISADDDNSSTSSEAEHSDDRMKMRPKRGKSRKSRDQTMSNGKNDLMMQQGDTLSEDEAKSLESEERKAFEYRISLIIDDLQDTKLH
ncbi:hypothetical protein WR25_19200 [Diploscapter pachys]|uniref:Alpha-catulin n=1 Tax=Diploscapter pachys TaxID=2018661 RepID=A0A2A2KRH9_9BILA|nr:hypothetical protein WR25_19200 [Diploscapter pachys]